MLELFKQLDHQLFFFINSHYSAWCDQIVYGITHTFFWVPLYLYLIYKIAISLKKRTGLCLVACAVLITLCDQFSAGLVKPWAQRLRPCQEPEIQHIVHVVGKYTGAYGFISSHAANTFGLAMFLWLLLRKQDSSIYLLFGWAASISYARVYGGVHYPSDVILGALSGIVWAWFVYQAYAYLMAYSNH